MTQVGLFGGTFDPIHWGHLLVAESVRETHALSKVVFIPAGQPWLKADQQVSPARHRLEMVKLAIADDPCFEASSIEVDRPGPSYSVDTVTSVRAEIGPEVGLSLIAGSDALIDLPLWKEPIRLARLCRIVEISRPGAALVDWQALEKAVAGISGNIDLVKVPQIDISSTDIRDRVRRGGSIRYRVPATVADYIFKNQLYQ